MAEDNVPFTSPAFIAASDGLSTYSGDANAKVQIVRLAHVIGAEGSKTVEEIVRASTPAVGAYGLTVRKPVVSTAHLVTLATTNATSVKAAPGTLKSVHVFNNELVPIFVKLHDVAVAPTPGAGVALTVGVQAGAHRDFVIPDGGRAFTVGLGMTVTGGALDNDATAVAADSSIEVCYE